MEELKLREKAAENFNKIYNCCQSVACTVCERYGVSQEDMFRMTEGFGSGIGGLKDTCGAVMGMFLIISLANSAGDMEDPTRTKLDTYAKFQKTQDGPQPLPCCMACVEDAAQILEELLKKWDILS